MKMAKLQETKSTIRFSAKLYRPKANEKTGSWTLTLPKDASAKLPSRGMTMVEGTINGFPFRAALEPNGKGSQWLRVNKTMRDAAGADAVNTVTVEITRAGEEPEIRVPMDLSTQRKIMRNVASLPNSQNRFFCQDRQSRKPRRFGEAAREIFGPREGASHGSFAFARTDSGISPYEARALSNI
jgi:Domain of unknown function (DUF1905)